MSEITHVLERVKMGDHTAASELMPLVYDELRRIAAHRMQLQPPGHTLQATALVHEAYLKLVAGEAQRWEHRGHFLAVAAEAMRQILVDNARRKLRARHGGQHQRVDLIDHDVLEISHENDQEKILQVHDALDELAREDPVKASVVKLHFFVGLTHAETAQALGLSEKTVRRHWNFARVWLYDKISQSL